MATTDPAEGRQVFRHLAPGLLSLGAWLGLAVGLVVALLEVLGNRYLRLGMRHIALERLALEANQGVLAGMMVAALVAVLAGLIRAGLLRWDRVSAHASMATWWILVSLGGIPSVLVLVYRLNRMPFFPRALSPAGLAANLGVTLGMFGLVFWLSAAIFRRRVRLAAFMGRLTRHRSVVAVVGLLLAANVLCLGDRVRLEPSGKNVVFITIDTLRPDHLGCYGYARDTSPNIDALASESALFGKTIVQWPKTGPSFASLLSSTYAHTNGVTRFGAQPIGKKFTMLAESFLNAGYRTAAIVTNPNVAAVFNFDQGFQEFDEIWRRHPEQDAEQVSDGAVDYLKRASKGAPFFLWLHYVDPHARYEPPEPYPDFFIRDPYYDESVKVPLGKTRSDDIGAIPGRSQLGDRQEVGFYVARYDAEIRYVDAQVGRVTEALEMLGLERNTMVVLTSDHGESLGEHNYYFEHGRLPYDDCTRVPLLLKIPGQTDGGQDFDRVVELIDVFPTLLEAAGIPPNPDAEGRSLMALMQGRPDGLPEFAFTESGYELRYQRAIQNDVWKLIYVPSEDDQAIMRGSRFELYNIQEDPGELVNLIETEPEVAEALKKELFERMGTSEEAAESKEVAGPPGGQGDIDAKSLEALRALGYVD